MTDPRARYVGRSIPLLHGDQIVTGRQRFVADLALPGTLHLAVVRSPHAHARLLSIDAAAAAGADGVVRVVTADEVAQHIEQIPHRVDPTTTGGRHTDVRPLAVGKVIYAGQPVAAVVAQTRDAARAAAALVRVEYETLPVVLDGEAALRSDAPRVIAEWPDNVLHRGRLIHGDVEAVFSNAPQHLAATLRLHRYSTQPIETRAYVASHSTFDDLLTVYATTQNPHQLRHQLAGALRRPENRIRVIAPQLGGAFGLKMIGHPEESLVCLMAILTGRPVKWVEEREECLIITGREQVHHVEVAFEADGRVTAFRDRFVANVGAPYATPGWGMAPLTAATLPCGYDIQTVEIDYTLAVTNKGPWTASRGYGKEASNIVMERVMDLVAGRLGMDPAEVRRRNLVAASAFPYRTATGLEIDSGDYQATLAQVLDLGDYDRWRDRQAQARAEGRSLGVGIACELTPEGGSLPRSLVAGYDTSTVRVDPSGQVTVLTGVTSPGGGNETGIAQVVADELSVPPDRIRVIQGDTDLCPYGFGNYSGRSVIAGGGSAALAAWDVRQKMAQVAAALLQTGVDALVFTDGQICDQGSLKRAVGFAEVAYAAYTRAYELASVVEPPLEATRTYRPPNIRHTPDEHGRVNPYPTYSNAAYVAVVEVDPQTGVVRLLHFAAVHDCGVAVNPALVDGQLRGAMTMGIGASLGEEIRYSPDGARLTTSFREYVMPRAGDLPPILIGHQRTPSPHTLLGNKGGGEAGVGGAAAAVFECRGRRARADGDRGARAAPHAARPVAQDRGASLVTGTIYLAARSVDAALAALHDLGPAATVLAGGQDVVPLMNQGRLAPTHLLDVSRLSELAALSADAMITIGPLVPHAALERHPVIRERLFLLADAARQIGGGVQVRNRGTLGGAVCAANPAYDLPACLLALDAVFLLASARGVRRLCAPAFFLGAGRTARLPDELLTAIEVPPQAPGSTSAYLKLKFTEGGYTIAGAACVLALTADGTCASARLALSGVTDVPGRVREVEAILAGERITDEILAEVAARVSASIVDPITDVMAGGAYRRAMAGVMARRAVARAAAA